MKYVVKFFNNGKIVATIYDGETKLKPNEELVDANELRDYVESVRKR